MDIKKLYRSFADKNNTDILTLYKKFENLSSEEISSLIDIAITDKKISADDQIDLFLYLALYSYSCGNKLPTKLYDYLIKNEVYYYGELYLRADESVADKLIAALEKDNGSNANHLLCAMSAIPCETTKKFLLKNSKEPLPKWAEKLYVLPIDYSKAFGWYVDDCGSIIKLYSDKITAFEQCKKSEVLPSSPVNPLTELCGYCHQPMTLVFDSEIKLATCLYCSCYEDIFVKQDGDCIQWHEKNEPQDFFKKHPEYMNNDEEGEITERFEYGIKLTDEQRRPTYTANQFAEISRTQIGGMPTPINDINYPKCPECGEIMKFVAQLDMEDIEEYGDGLYYFFSCKNCNVHAANYAQT